MLGRLSCKFLSYLIYTALETRQAFRNNSPCATIYFTKKLWATKRTDYMHYYCLRFIIFNIYYKRSCFILTVSPLSSYIITTKINMSYIVTPVKYPYTCETYNGIRVKYGLTCAHLINEKINGLFSVKKYE